MTTTDPYAFLRTDLTGVPPLEAMGAAYHEPAAADRIPNTQPERVMYVPGPGGTMVPVLADHYQPAPAAPGPAAQDTPAAVRDKWPLRMFAGGGATAMVIGVVGHYGQGINAAGHGMEAAGIGVAVVCGCAGAAVMLFKGALGGKQGSRVDVHLTVNNTVHGGNATARSKSRS